MFTNRLPTLLLALGVLALGAAPGEAQDLDLSGEWEMEWTPPNGPARTMTFVLAQEAAEVGGEMTMSMGRREMTAEVEGQLEGSTLSFQFEVAPPGRAGGRGQGRGRPAGGGERPTPIFKFTGDVDGDQITGRLTTPRGEEVDGVLTRVDRAR